MEDNMLEKIIGWVLQRKFKDESGDLVYKGVSLTKVGVLLLSLCKAIEEISIVAMQQGFLDHQIIIPSLVYSIIAALTAIAARDSVVHNETPTEEK